MNAVAHILIPLLFFDAIRHYIVRNEREFPRYLVLIGGIAGLLPDIDIPMGWATALFTGSSVNFHGQFTHTIFFALIFFALFVGAYFYCRSSTHRKAKKNTLPLVFLVVAIGILFHLLLDCATGGYSFFWPLNNANACISLIPKSLIVPIDAIFLVLWLLHEEYKHRIIEYF